MKTQVGFALIGLMLCRASAIAGEKAYAPLPDKVVAAKTVVLLNESGI
jgi:hypothetical protein